MGGSWPSHVMTSLPAVRRASMPSAGTPSVMQILAMVDTPFLMYRTIPARQAVRPERRRWHGDREQKAAGVHDPA